MQENYKECMCLNNNESRKEWIITRKNAAKYGRKVSKTFLSFTKIKLNIIKYVLYKFATNKTVVRVFTSLLLFLENNNFAGLMCCYYKLRLLFNNKIANKTGRRNI